MPARQRFRSGIAQRSCETGKLANASDHNLNTLIESRDEAHQLLDREIIQLAIGKGGPGRSDLCLATRVEGDSEASLQFGTMW